MRRWVKYVCAVIPMNLEVGGMNGGGVHGKGAQPR